MPARRCPVCLTNWPNHVRYASCKACDGKTDVVSNSDPVSQSEANHIEFEAFYRRHEEKQAKARADAEAERVAALEDALAAPAAPGGPVEAQPESD